MSPSADAAVRLVNDPEVMADPFVAYRKWQRGGPVHQATTPDGAPVWLVTRYRDVKTALNDPRLSLNKIHARDGYRGYALPPALDANLLNLDPPDHTRLRRLISQVFTARRVSQLRPQIQAITDDLLDAVDTAQPVDLMGSLAVPLPVNVIGELLGVPAAERGQFRTWTTTLTTPARPADAAQAVANMQGYLTDLIARKRAEPADDLISAMIAARDHNDRLNEDELTSLAFLTLWAGYEASVHLIGNGILELLRHPDQLALLRSRPELLPAAADELLRYTGPIPYAIRRFPTENIEIAGTAIPAGATVLLCLAAANRDPDRFPTPDTLDITRSDTAHLAFGHGIHHCLGAALARLETEIALGTLLNRYPRITLAINARNLRWHPSFRSRGLLELPITCQ